MNPLPEGFSIKLIVKKLKTNNRRRLNFQLVTPSHPDGIVLSGHSGTILASLLVDYGRSVARSHLFNEIWGDDESGGPLDWEKVIDVIICNTRRKLRLVGVDFDYAGDYGRSGRRALTLTNLRECQPYGIRPKSYLKSYSERKARAAEIGRQAEEYAMAQARRTSVFTVCAASRKGCPEDRKLRQAKEAFQKHNRPLPDLWSKPARVEAWEARGERS